MSAQGRTYLYDPRKFDASTKTPGLSTIVVGLRWKDKPGPYFFLLVYSAKLGSLIGVDSMHSIPFEIQICQFLG